LCAACGTDQPLAVTSPTPTPLAIATPSASPTPTPSATASPTATPCPSPSSLISAPLWPRAVNIAYDSTRSQVVLFGGLGATISNDTWTWDGSQWMRRESAAMPSTRAGAALADDPQHRVVVMFGGDKAGDYRGDTWLWNGAWHQVCPAHSPSPRTGAAMTYDPIRPLPEGIVYDSARKVIVVVVPIPNSASTAVNAMETWSWNGATWSRLSPHASPPRRDGSGLAYDAARSLVVLAGGLPSGRVDPTTTWGWNEATWSELSGVPA
jgi:hypothetical protein